MENKQKHFRPQWNREKLITSNQILHEGEKSSLIKLPENGPLAGFKMWYPNRLIKYGHPYVSLIYREGMEFRIYNGLQEKILTDKQFMRVQTCEEENHNGTAQEVTQRC